MRKNTSILENITREGAMAYASILVLILVFLSAILLHYLLRKKEAFQEASRTPLTKENVQAVLDKFVQDIINNYQKFKKEGEKVIDKRIRYRLVDCGNMINALNAEYPRLEYLISQLDYSSFSVITLEDVNLVMNFISQRVGLTSESNITDPANISDLDMLTNRTINITSVLQQKAALVRGGTRMLEEFMAKIGISLTNLAQLKRNFGGMKPQDIPILRADLTYYALAGALNNFTIDPELENEPIPELELGNLPAGKSLTKAIIDKITPNPAEEKPTTPTVTAPAPPSVPSTTTTRIVQTPTGMKFSELIQALMAYGPMKPEVPKKSTQDDVLKVAYDASLTSAGSNVYIDQIKTTIRDEIASQLKNVKMGPKDAVNDELVGRSIEPINPIVPPTTSDALQQGSWFRTAASEGCPYAQGQIETPMQPIDMSQYIRKDQIPCWGCTLK